MIHVYIITGIIKKIGAEVKTLKNTQKEKSIEINKKVYKKLGKTNGVLDFFIANVRNY